MTSLGHFIILSAAIFCIGLYGVLTRRNSVGILISVELILNSANINLVAFSRFSNIDNMTGQVFALFVIATAASAAVVGLALIISVYRNARTVYADDINLLKG